MRAPIGRIASLLLVAVVAACGPIAARPRADQDIITRDQMESQHFITVYDAITALHSNWLIERPLTLGVSAGNPQVVIYMDQVRLGNADELRNVLVKEVSYIRHYSAMEATTRFGVGHAQGAIVISTHPL
jgi:hypothetical protein